MEQHLRSYNWHQFSFSQSRKRLAHRLSTNINSAGTSRYWHRFWLLGSFSSTSCTTHPRKVGQRTTPNTDNLLAQRPINATEEQKYLSINRGSSLGSTRKRKSVLCHDVSHLRPSYLASVTTKPYQVGHAVPNIQKFDSRRGSTREHVSRFIDAMRPFSHNTDLCHRYF